MHVAARGVLQVGAGWDQRWRVRRTITVNSPALEGLVAVVGMMWAVDDTAGTGEGAGAGAGASARAPRTLRSAVAVHDALDGARAVDEVAKLADRAA